MKRKYGLIVGMSVLAGTLSMNPSVFAQTGVPADSNSTTTMKGQLDDTVITAKAKAALHDDKDTSNAVDAIHVQTNGGVVTLMGEVSNQSQAEHAQMVVARLSGVRDVVNDLKYPTSPGANSNPSVVPPAAANDSSTTTNSSENSTSATTTSSSSTVPN